MTEFLIGMQVLTFISIFRMWISEFADKKTVDNEVHLYFAKLKDIMSSEVYLILRRKMVIDDFTFSTNQIF